MARKEEIKEIAKSYQQKIESQNPSAEAYDYFNAVIYGAEWSDEHPKEGMVDINEIGDWLIKNKDAFDTEHGFEMVRCVYHMKKAFDAYMQAKKDMTKKVLDVKF